MTHSFTCDGRRDTPGYANAFNAYLGGDGGVAAALQTDQAASGGYLAPPAFVADVARELDTKDWFRKLASVLPPTAAPKVSMPRRTIRPDAFTWATELATPTPDASLKFGTMSLTPHPMTAEFEVSADLFRAVPTFTAILTEEIACRVGDLEEPAFLAGNGAGKPLGLFAPDANGIGTDRDATGDVSDFGFIRGVRLSLRSPYLRSESLRWLLHPNAAKHLSKMKSSSGEPCWKPSQRAGDPDSIDNVPIAYSDSAPAGSGPNGTYVSGDYFGLLGDLSYYSIQDGVDLSVNRLTDSYYARRNMVGFLVRRKVDGMPRVSEAFVRIKVQ